MVLALVLVSHLQSWRENRSTTRNEQDWCGTSLLLVNKFLEYSGHWLRLIWQMQLHCTVIRWLGLLLLAMWGSHAQVLGTEGEPLTYYIQLIHGTDQERQPQAA